ncbi:hypothetical protein BABINDRAFT_162708 [Babjeviella inositovora NRRL Y-12698]|uniref:SMP-30/Gluconolactonase/LRE-like region domain-containing protein n=1 Tax=Babjeviella inositovora NRRL Y-12698 TaxID=984486 RepID=A0A1E3QLB8_9ASCO|nr:uncharacterized protein BABINDRAFT_162708 [Babjeviella inositovora NRRL Y-12698]ODQ78499.1 hypothetical protein BABINDRAFT_162708 [Babjeviella inositovora NRRL Y-12698]
MKSVSIKKPFLNFNSLLGEAPCYNPRNNTVCWVDALGSQIHRIQLLPNSDKIAEYTDEQIAEVTKTHETISCKGETIGSIALTADDNVLALNWTQGFGFASFKTKELIVKDHFPLLATDPILRMNDGIIDPHGNYIMGSMDKHVAATSSETSKLWRINTDLSVDVLLEGIGMSNGINFFVDPATGKLHLFYTDTLVFTIWKFDYDPESRTLSNKQPHINIVDFVPMESLPGLDGFSITDTGDIYTAVWGSHVILHFDYDGKLVGEFKFPAARVTSCTFMGPAKDELFVTTASLKIPAEDGVDTSDVNDLGGALFRVKLDGVKGNIKCGRWGGKVDV